MSEYVAKPKLTIAEKQKDVKMSLSKAAKEPRRRKEERRKEE